jgi:hypothetical protein
MTFLLHAGGWTLLLATRGDFPTALFVMAAWFGAAIWVGAKARSWWWPATWAIDPMVLLAYTSRIMQDSDPDVAWAFLLLAALFVASLVPMAGAVIGVIVGKVMLASDGKQAQPRD